MIEAESQITNPIELLDSIKTTPELLEFSRQAFNRGHLRFNDFYNLDLIQEKYFKFLVTIHELGHELVAKGIGWIVKKFVNTAGLGYGGFVEVKPPSGVDMYQYLLGLGTIAAGGQEGLRSKMGAGADDMQVAMSSSLLGVGKASLHSGARIFIPGKNDLWQMAFPRL